MILPTSNYRVGTVAEGSRGILQGFLEGKVRHRETMMKDPWLPHLAHEAIGLGPSNTRTTIAIYYSVAFLESVQFYSRGIIPPCEYPPGLCIDCNNL